MVTDDERRQVSAWFRECAKDRNYWPGIMKIAEVLGVPHVPWGGTEGRLLDALADLIDPDTDQLRDTTKLVDRDALLTIAGEMEVTGREYRYMVSENFVTSDLIDDAPEDFVEYARRIRKACGEEER